jgi:hypothetical protein
MSSFPDFSRLQLAIQNLGISLEDCISRLDAGIEITSDSEYVSAPDGFYDLQPTGDILRIIIHIGQGGADRCSEDPEKWHRYHTAQCAAYGPPSRHLKQIKTRRNDGFFNYKIYDSTYREYDSVSSIKGRPLLVCGHCQKKLANLDLLDINGTPDLKTIFAGDIAHRLHRNPVYCDGDIIFGFPEQDWESIAGFVKQKALWHCSRCSADMRCAKKFLHAHYSNTDGRLGSLGRVLALCAGCHALQKGHDKLLNAVRSSFGYKDYRSRFSDHQCFKTTD